MAQQKFQIVSNKTQSALSPDEMKSRYFFGIPIIDPSGRKMSDETINDLIGFAITELEGFLEIKLSRQIVKETLDFHVTDWRKWGFIPVTFPVLEVYKLTGTVGNVQQIEFPKSWLSIKRSTDPYAAHRKVQIVPNIGVAGSTEIVYSGITPHLGWFSMDTIPDYWVLEYCTSFKKIPGDILDMVGKLAAVNIFHNMGDIILGAGIANQSISIDGLSQSIGTTSSATNAGYGARITGYLDDLKRNLPKLRHKYKGITFTSV